MQNCEHPYLKVEAHARLSSSYYNQLTQHFEPLVEPWALSTHVVQKEQGAMFKMRVESLQMININFTYGMFASLRHI